MDDRIDIAPFDRGFDELLIRDIADNQLGFGRYSPFEAGAQPVDDHHVFARIEHAPDHVAADVSRAAGDKSCQVFDPYVFVV